MESFFPVLLLTTAIGLALLFSVQLYDSVVRHASVGLLVRLAVGIGATVIISYTVTGITTLAEPPRSSWIIFWGVATGALGGHRLLFRELFRAYVRSSGEKRVLVYGAGEAGKQLAEALKLDDVHHIVAFLDDDQTLQGCRVQDLRVHDPAITPALVDELSIDAVLLAMPSVSRSRRADIIRRLESLPIEVLVIPGLSELASGDCSVTNIRKVNIEDILVRDSVVPDPALLSSSVEGRSVLITGAGGSIGSELCRQILGFGPKRLVLYERSEYALYQITSELKNAGFERDIVPILGDVMNRGHMDSVLKEYDTDVVYHAAAYKHVPLVECNVIEGVRNNTLGTLHAAQAALSAGVERFVLISTDKAVRPTNAMGASKRLAELVLQALAEENHQTCFSMVRFGNVLGSSGSVVPLFRKQIQEGGPVTVTHPDVTRYFMTIPEAVSLVLQSASMAEGGDVFLLDMGEPVKIADLAKRLIRLSGLEVQDQEHPHGDIPIEFIGLRPGEKLFEELLLSEEDRSTAHPRIRKAFEAVVSWSLLSSELHHLRMALDRRDEQTVLRVLSAFVDGYEPAGIREEVRVA